MFRPVGPRGATICRRFGKVAVRLAFAMILAACQPIADGMDGYLNPVHAGAPAAPSSHYPVHARLFVADMHADTLLWERPLLDRSPRGHVDVPRLVAGGVDLQIFAVVTKTPPERHTHGSEDTHCVPTNGVNLAGLLSVVQGRDPATWFDLRARALLQAARLRDAAARSATEGPAKLLPILSFEDLLALIANAQAPSGARPVVGVVLGLEGANWIGGAGVSTEQVRAGLRDLFEAGFRTVALTHRFDNALAGASEGCGPDRRLTAQGRAALDEAQRLGMTIDLAHLAPEALRDALPLLTRPPLVSHTGVSGHCEPPCHRPRNLSDDELRGIAERGGVIGIGFWPEAVGPGGRLAILRAFAHAAQAIGSGATAAFEGDPWNHLGFGSDFDGAVAVPFDAAGMPDLTWALLNGAPDVAPLTPQALARVAGANVCRVLAMNLPSVAPSEARPDAAARQRACLPLLERRP